MLSVDECLEKLLACRTAPPGTEVNLPEEAIIKIVRNARDIFLQQPMLLEIAGGLAFSAYKFECSQHFLIILYIIYSFSR